MVQKTIFSLSTAVFFFLRARKKNSHGSPSNINQHTLSESHAKFGAFIRPVMVISLSHLTTRVRVEYLVYYIGYYILSIAMYPLTMPSIRGGILGWISIYIPPVRTNLIGPFHAPMQ